FEAQGKLKGPPGDMLHIAELPLMTTLSRPRAPGSGSLTISSSRPSSPSLSSMKAFDESSPIAVSPAPQASLTRGQPLRGPWRSPAGTEQELRRSVRVPARQHAGDVVVATIRVRQIDQLRAGRVQVALLRQHVGHRGVWYHA